MTPLEIAANASRCVRQLGAPLRHARGAPAQRVAHAINWIVKGLEIAR